MAVDIPGLIAGAGPAGITLDDLRDTARKAGDRPSNTVEQADAMVARGEATRSASTAGARRYTSTGPIGPPTGMAAEWDAASLPTTGPITTWPATVGGHTLNHYGGTPLALEHPAQLAGGPGVVIRDRGAGGYQSPAPIPLPTENVVTLWMIFATTAPLGMAAVHAFAEIGAAAPGFALYWSDFLAAAYIVGTDGLPDVPLNGTGGGNPPADAPPPWPKVYGIALSLNFAAGTENVCVNGQLSNNVVGGPMGLQGTSQRVTLGPPAYTKPPAATATAAAWPGWVSYFAWSRYESLATPSDPKLVAFGRFAASRGVVWREDVERDDIVLPVRGAPDGST